MPTKKSKPATKRSAPTLAERIAALPDEEREILVDLVGRMEHPEIWKAKQAADSNVPDDDDDEGTCISPDGVMFESAELGYVWEGVLLAAEVYYRLHVPVAEFNSFFSVAHTLAKGVDQIKRGKVLDIGLG